MDRVDWRRLGEYAITIHCPQWLSAVWITPPHTSMMFCQGGQFVEPVNQVVEPVRRQGAHDADTQKKLKAGVGQTGV